MDLNRGQTGSDLSFFHSFSCIFFFAVRRESGFSLSFSLSCGYEAFVCIFFSLHRTFVQWKGRSREPTDDLLTCLQFSRLYNDFLLFIAPSLDLLRLSSQLLTFWSDLV